MDIETLRRFCLSLEGTTEGMKWDHLCFMIEEKIFVLLSIEEKRLVLKCKPEVFDERIEREYIVQAPHFAKRQWLEIRNFHLISESELSDWIKQSRSLVLSKMSKKIKEKYNN